MAKPVSGRTMLPQRWVVLVVLMLCLEHRPSTSMDLMGMGMHEYEQPVHVEVNKANERDRKGQEFDSQQLFLWQLLHSMTGKDGQFKDASGHQLEMFKMPFEQSDAREKRFRRIRDKRSVESLDGRLQEAMDKPDQSGHANEGSEAEGPREYFVKQKRLERLMRGKSESWKVKALRKLFRDAVEGGGFRHQALSPLKTGSKNGKNLEYPAKGVPRKKMVVLRKKGHGASLPIPIVQTVRKNRRKSKEDLTIQELDKSQSSKRRTSRNLGHLTRREVLKEKEEDDAKKELDLAEIRKKSAEKLLKPQRFQEKEGVAKAVVLKKSQDVPLPSPVLKVRKDRKQSIKDLQELDESQSSRISQRGEVEKTSKTFGQLGKFRMLKEKKGHRDTKKELDLEEERKKVGKQSLKSRESVEKEGVSKAVVLKKKKRRGASLPIPIVHLRKDRRPPERDLAVQELEASQASKSKSEGVGETSRSLGQLAGLKVLGEKKKEQGEANEDLDLEERRKKLAEKLLEPREALVEKEGFLWVGPRVSDQRLHEILDGLGKGPRLEGRVPGELRPGPEVVEAHRKV